MHCDRALITRGHLGADFEIEFNIICIGFLHSEPGYLFLAIIVFLGILGSLAASALAPSIDDVWGTTDAIVLEGTEWWEYEIEHEDCLYDEYYDEYYDCIYTYSYDCGADVPRHEA